MAQIIGTTLVLDANDRPRLARCDPQAEAARHNSRRVNALALTLEAEQVLRSGLRFDGLPWRGTESEVVRLSQCLRVMRFHLATHPELQA